MKYILPTLALVLAPSLVSAEESYRIGVGASAEYNGIGVALYRADTEQLFYGSLGYGGNFVSEESYGIGVGWLTSKPFNGNRHSVGIHASVNHYSEGFPDQDDKVSGKLLGQYVYNFNGIGKQGFHFSVYAGMGSASHEGKFQAGVGAGYRF